MSDQLEMMALRDAGEATVLVAIGEQAASEIRARIITLAEQDERFTSDDVRRMLGPATTAAIERHPNALSACFSSCSRAGLIRRVGYTTSARDERRGSPIAEWRGRAEA